MTVLDDLGVNVIDVDTHVIEPYDLWTSRVSVNKYGDRVPHVRTDENGIDTWYTGETSLMPAGALAAAGWKEAPGWGFPPNIDMIDPRVWQPAPRLQVMDEQGTYAQVLYPNVTGFGAGRFQDITDHELAYLLIQAYNDFLTDFARVNTHRYIPIMAVPFFDLDLSIKEMERCRANGHKGMIFSMQPETWGQPILSDPYWDRLWAAAQDLRLPVHFHIASGDLSSILRLHESVGRAAAFAAFPPGQAVNNINAISTLICSGICHRFPELQFVSVESGISWIPFALQYLDWLWIECQVHREHPEYDLLPSDYFRRQIFGCFWFENTAAVELAIDQLGADRILYETDFPHPVCMAPGPASEGGMTAREYIDRNLGTLPEEVLRKILQDNATRLYDLDPA
jgi:predicted TIM-barrel fold metal-dependent hydrolase